MFSRNVFGKMIAISFCVALALGTSEAAQITLKPVDDAFIRLFGGGEGCVAFVKFNIASIPAGQTIDSAIIQGYVWYVNTGWDGDAKFFNANSQTWQETDSAAVLHRIPSSDSTHQASGFGPAVGWTRSVDVKAIFLTDYDARRTFCSFKMRDPDDRTLQPMPGALAYDYADTLAVGNRAMRQNIYFYPHEYTADSSRIIRLTVYYHGTGVSSPVNEGRIVEFEVAPNPFRSRTEIRYMIPDTRARMEKPTLRIYDIAGTVVKDLTNRLGSAILDRLSAVSWDGKDNFGKEVAPGVYIYRFGCGQDVRTGKIVRLN